MYFPDYEANPIEESPLQLYRVWEATMITRRWFICSFMLFLIPLAAAAGDAKATKRTIRAADGLNIVCDVNGKGDTALIFLHGWCGEREYWKHQVPAFSGDFRIVTVDQAG